MKEKGNFKMKLYLEGVRFSIHTVHTYIHMHTTEYVYIRDVGVQVYVRPAFPLHVETDRWKLKNARIIFLPSYYCVRYLGRYYRIRTYVRSTYHKMHAGVCVHGRIRACVRA